MAEIHSVLRLNRGLKAYATIYAGDRQKLTYNIQGDQWDSLAEIEAILQIVHFATTIVQTEQFMMGGLGFVIRGLLIAHQAFKAHVQQRTLRERHAMRKRRMT